MTQVAETSFEDFSLPRTISEIEWKKVAGMRDRLIHNYSDVDYFIVWDVAETKAPDLVRQLRPVVESYDKNT